MKAIGSLHSATFGRSTGHLRNGVEEAKEGASANRSAAEEWAEDRMKLNRSDGAADCCGEAGDRGDGRALLADECSGVASVAALASAFSVIRSSDSAATVPLLLTPSRRAFIEAACSKWFRCIALPLDPPDAGLLRLLLRVGGGVAAGNASLAVVCLRFLLLCRTVAVAELRRSLSAIECCCLGRAAVDRSVSTAAALRLFRSVDQPRAVCPAPCGCLRAAVVDVVLECVAGAICQSSSVNLIRLRAAVRMAAARN